MTDKQKKALKLIAERLGQSQYAIRGTASLVLQGLEMHVADLDILCDKEVALECNQLFKEYLISKVAFSETEKFKSYFGKFEIEGIPVEVMGEWQIKDGKSKWSQVFNASAEEKTKIILGNQEISVTNFETELKMFALMGRWTAYHKIRKQLRAKLTPRLF